MAFKKVSDYSGLLKLIDKIKLKKECSQKELYLELYDPTVVNHIRLIVMKAVGLGKLDSTLDLIEGLFLENKEIYNNQNLIFLGNLSYLCPNEYWRNIEFFKKYLEFYDNRASSLLLSRVGNFHKFLNFIDTNKDVHLSPTIVLHMAFNISIYCVQDEVKWLQKLLLKLDKSHQSHLVNNAILRRINGIQSINKNNERIETKEGQERCALFITGQLRNVQSMLPKIKDYYNLPALDIYISTWKNEGRTSIDRARMSRRVELKHISQIESLYSDEDLKIISDYDKALYQENNQLENLIKKTLGNSQELHINMLDDNEVVYQDMDNHQKMYFHNSYWIRKLGEEYFLNKYTIMAKTRPDLLLRNENLSFDNILCHREIGCDHPGWIYETWGFGMGDQLFFGKTRDVLPLLNITYPKSLSTRLLSEVFGAGRMYQGHITLGIELWLQGGRPVDVGIKKQGLISDYKMNKKEFMKLAEEAGVYKHHEG